MIVDRVKRIHIHLHLFFQDRKLPKELPVIIPFSVFCLQMLHKSRRIPCCFLRKKLHLRLHLAPHLFPFLLAVCHPASTVRRVPEMVVVLAEFLFQPGDFFFLAFQEIIIQDLRSQNFVFCFPLLIFFSSETVRADVNCLLIKFIQNIFHRDICCQIPDSPLPFLSAPQMAEKTVQKFVEIQPVDHYFVLHKHRKQPLWGHIEKFPVRAQHLCLA